MSVQYNVDIAKFQTDPPVKAFSLESRANPFGRNQSHITYQSCQRWISFVSRLGRFCRLLINSDVCFLWLIFCRWTYTEESPRSGLAVLDVTIPTGYIIQQQKLDAYVRSRNVRNLQRARFLEQKVVFYFEYVRIHPSCGIFLNLNMWKILFFHYSYFCRAKYPLFKLICLMSWSLISRRYWLLSDNWKKKTKHFALFFESVMDVPPFLSSILLSAFIY